MRRTSVRIGLGAVAVMAGLALTACGSDDSSASSTPTFTSSTGSAPTSGAVTSSAAPTSPGAAATAPPTGDQSVPSGFPGPTDAPAIDARGDRFLAALKAKGVTYATDGSVAIATANYICAARADGVANDQITTFVTANVGSEASISGATVTTEQAGATAQTYIDVATSTFCS